MQQIELARTYLWHVRIPSQSLSKFWCPAAPRWMDTNDDNHTGWGKEWHKFRPEIATGGDDCSEREAPQCSQTPEIATGGNCAPPGCQADAAQISQLNTASWHYMNWYRTQVCSKQRFRVVGFSCQTLKLSALAFACWKSPFLHNDTIWRRGVERFDLNRHELTGEYSSSWFGCGLPLHLAVHRALQADKHNDECRIQPL